MNRSIEQALLSLLPTHNSTLPKPLTELASSLLAQSRHRASTLKAEEEIARLYACSHIACDRYSLIPSPRLISSYNSQANTLTCRLKITLNLPPIEPRPPIPPRIYKRLYNHLDNILPATATSSTPGRGTPRGEGGRIRTPSTKLREAAQNPLGTSPLANKSRATPTKEKSLAQFRATPTGTLSKTRTPATASRTPKPPPSGPLPPWVRPTLRFVCSEVGPRRIGPVVMAGFESIVAPHGKRTEDGWVNGNLVALLGALYLYVWRGVTSPGGQDLDPAKFVSFRKSLVRALSKAREAVEVTSKAGDEDGEPWAGWYDVRIKDLDTAALRTNRHGWLEMDWAAGIEDLVRAGQGVNEADEEETGDDDARPEVGQIRRADTMFQERYDYLSERKRKEYAIWKEGILRRIKELERDPGQVRTQEEDVMDIDEEL